MIHRTVEEFATGHIQGAVNVPYMNKGGSGKLPRVCTHYAFMGINCHYIAWTHLNRISMLMYIGLGDCFAVRKYAYVHLSE